MVELSLACYSEAKILKWQTSQAKRSAATSVSLKSIVAYIAEGHIIDLANESIRTIHFYPKGGPLQPGQLVSNTELKDAGVTEILVRWDRARKVNALKL